MATEYNNDIIEATEYLKTTVAKECAIALDRIAYQK
jgi:hypothetical protein